MSVNVKSCKIVAGVFDKPQLAVRAFSNSCWKRIGRGNCELSDLSSYSWERLLDTWDDLCDAGNHLRLSSDHDGRLARLWRTDSAREIDAEG
jgi:hypothetical protein